MNRLQTGRITTWKDDRGFGFITPDAGGPDVFVHVSGFVGAGRRPAGGERVSYEVELGPDGKPQATNVHMSRGWRPRVTWDRIVSALWLGGLMVLVAVGDLPVWVPALYVLASVAAFATYAVDKARAGTEARRIPERVLHLLELLGGWPGALVAQQQFRHKTRKVSYQVLFWLIVVAHIAAAAWWCYSVRER